VTGVLDALAALVVGAATEAEPRPPLRFETGDDAEPVEVEVERREAPPLRPARAGRPNPLAEEPTPRLRRIDEPPPDRRPSAAEGAARAESPSAHVEGAPPAPGPTTHVETRREERVERAETVERTTERLVESHEVLVPAEPPPRVVEREVAPVVEVHETAASPAAHEVLVATTHAEPTPPRELPPAPARAPAPVVAAEPLPAPPVVPPVREEEPPRVHVAIGRVEVVAPSPPAPTPKRPALPREEPATPDLGAYLASLEGGRG